MTIALYAPEDLSARKTDGKAPLLVDVRTPAEFETVRIEGSRNLPLDELQRDPKTLAAQLPAETILICQSGARSKEAAETLAAAGSEQTKVLAGGIIGYQNCGGEALREEQRWAMERQVRMAAGTLVVGGLLGAKLIHPRLAYVSAGVGSGLIFAAATNTCAMARALSLLPWNRTEESPTVEAFLQDIPDVTAG
jgi:rhodanese-related sulfurtransferase